MLLRYHAEQKRILNNRICHLILKLPQRATRRRFWVRTSSWWDNFVNGVVVDVEWMENFLMSRASLVTLSEELHPYIKRQTTAMRATDFPSW